MHAVICLSLNQNIRNSCVKNKVKSQRLKRKFFCLILRSKCLNLRCSTPSRFIVACVERTQKCLSLSCFCKRYIEQNWRVLFQAVWFVLSTLISGKEENTFNYTNWHEITRQIADNHTVVGNERLKEQNGRE